MLWIIALMLILLAGLNAPLALCAISLAALNGQLMPRAELSWLASPWLFGLALALLALQLLADLYFVPIRVKDRVYLSPGRTENNYLHARVQSFLRPLFGAVLVAALPLPLPDWPAAVLGFSGTTAIYWLSAWIREYTAIARGALVLLALETIKNGVLIALGLLTFWLPPLALLLLLVLLGQTSLWTMRLQREQLFYGHQGGQRAGEDS
jgi:hypothetical protein